MGLINEKGEHYQLKYDKKERLIEEIGFDGRATRYGYNAAGHLSHSVAVTDPASGEGLHTTFERDAFGRLLKEITPEGSTTFGYNASGQLTHAENAQRSQQWEYDAVGQISADWQDDKVIRHHYNANGQRTQSALPNGETLHYHFNAAGQFTRLQRQTPGSDAQQLLAEIQHDELGREIARSHGNGLHSRKDYDPQGRLQQQQVGLISETLSNSPPAKSPWENEVKENKGPSL